MLLTVGLLLPADILFHSKANKITGVSTEINSLYIEFLRDNRFVNDFLTTEPDNAEFFFKGESPFLVSHRQAADNLNSKILLAMESGQTKVFGISNDLSRLNTRLAEYNTVFDSLVYLVYKRGYRNFGLKGELADYAQRIEEVAALKSNDIRMLRKIENDYFFNTDTASITVFSNILSRINTRISVSNLPESEKKAALGILNNYGDAFLRLAQLDRKTGIIRNRALRASLNDAIAGIEILFSTLNDKTQVAQRTLLARLRFYYVLTLLVIFSMALLFSYKTSKHIVSHLEALTNYISALASGNAGSNHPIDLQNSAREIKQIYREFRNLFSQLKVWEKQRDSAIQHADDNQQRYRELADMLPQSVFETDSYGNYTYVNRAWHQSFGYNDQDLNEGLNLIETLISESNAEDILGAKKIENSSFIAVRKNGSRFPVSVYTDNILKNSKIAGRRGIIIDITERVNYIRSLQQETSKAKTSDELKSSFLANMSHEIRTPMNSIIGFSNLLASEQVPETQKKDFTHYIQTSSEILLNLVDDIIDIAKIEAGELKIIKKECNLTALGTELLTTSTEARKKFNKQHIQLRFIKDDLNPDICLKTDPFRLRQILINLINNAIKFTEKGSVEFGYSIKDDTVIEFYVKDTGPGLSREELDMIFERFKRAKRSDEKNIVGTGLGLAIAKNLVQLLGGEMWVDSSAGIGTTFLFTLPYLRPTILPSEDANTYHAAESYNWQGKKILIVEDDPNSFKFLTELLKKTRIEILHASNGKAAVDVVKNDSAIDIVLMDIQLPVMDGLEATRLIKGINQHLPVIAQTAYAMAGDKDKMKFAGCDDYISKPLSSRQLQAVIHHFLFVAKKPVQPVSPSSIISNRSSF